MKIIITGAAGFIGASLVRQCLIEKNWRVLGLDKLTYAGNLSSLQECMNNSRFSFVKGDISDADGVKKILNDFQPDAIINLAAESHVDRSLLGSSPFIQTNVVGTFNLLECVRYYWSSLKRQKKNKFRFLHISTDEVFGSLGPTGKFDESTPYRPNSPYAASKAASDHLVRAWGASYNLPVIVTNCANNYGPFQFPEKLIPLTILRALKGEAIPVYGDGNCVRDWIHVDDHSRALKTILLEATPGESFCIGGNSEKTNLEVVNSICQILDNRFPNASPHNRLIEHVPDRPGHDRRYSIDNSHITRETTWAPTISFCDGLEETVHWYLTNSSWLEGILSGSYRDWIDENYTQRSSILGEFAS